MFHHNPDSENSENRALEMLMKKAEEKTEQKGEKKTGQKDEQKDEGGQEKYFSDILEWAKKKSWDDSDGRLPGYFLGVSPSGPVYPNSLDVYVAPGAPPGEFQVNNTGPWTRGNGWLVFKGQGEPVVWVVGDPEPELVAEHRKQKAKETKLTSDPKLRSRLVELFGQAPGEAGGVTNAERVLKIITASSFSEKGNAARLFNVSIALHLHGAEIFEIGMAHGGHNALATAFEEALGHQGGRVVWLDGPGKVALEEKTKDKGAFVTWSQQLWGVMAKISPDHLDETAVEKVFNHDKGYLRSIPLAEELSLARTGSDEPLVTRLRNGQKVYAESLDPLGNLITAFLHLALIGTNPKPTYAEFAKLCLIHEASIKKVYEGGVDIESKNARDTLADDYDIK